MKLDRFDARLLMKYEDILEVDKRKNFVKYVPNDPDDRLAELDRYHDLLYLNGLSDMDPVENKQLLSHVDRGIVLSLEKGKEDPINDNKTENNNNIIKDKETKYKYEIIIPKDEIMIKRIDKTSKIIKLSNPESISQLNELKNKNHNYSFMNNDDILYPYFEFLKLNDESRDLLLNNENVHLKEIDIPDNHDLKTDIIKFIDKLKNVPPQFIDFVKKNNPNSLYLHEHSKYYEYYNYIKEIRLNNAQKSLIDFIHSHIQSTDERREDNDKNNHHSSKSRSRSRSRSRGRRRKRRSYSSSSSDSSDEYYSSSDSSSYSSESSESSYHKKRRRRRRRKRRSSSSSSSSDSYSRSSYSSRSSSSSSSSRYRRRKKSKY